MNSATRPVCALITTCKGRLAFLRRTLPMMVKTGFPVTVVDYDCPENTRGYVTENFPTVNLVHVERQPLFHLAKARNIGAQNSRSDMILFVDCDVILSEACVSFLQSGVFPSGEFWAGGSTYDLTGTCLLPRPAFAEIGGYDEVIHGWGYQDIDLYNRLEARGLRKNKFDGDLVSAIAHDNALRVQFTGETDSLTYEASKIYSRIKLDVENRIRRQLTLSDRQKLRRLVENVLERSRATNRSVVFSVSLSAPSVSRKSADAAFKRSYTVHPLTVREVGIGESVVVDELD